MNSAPSLWNRFQARVEAARFFPFSLLVHLIIVLLGGSVVLVTSISSRRISWRLAPTGL